MKFFLGCFVLVACVSCTTLENRRDLYSPDPEYWQGHEPQVSSGTTTRQTTPTTSTISQPAPRREEIEPPALPQ